MGLHQDRDETDLGRPGALGLARRRRASPLSAAHGRKDPTRALSLLSGDVVVLGGKSRLRFHGVDRVLAGTSNLVPGGGRINLTLRRVTRG